jgi:hypothetical protein
MITREQEKTAKKVLDCAFEVHSSLGPGLLESTYQACLQYELQTQGVFVECEKAIPVVYKGIIIDCGYRIDMVIEHTEIIIELWVKFRACGGVLHFDRLSVYPGDDGLPPAGQDFHRVFAVIAGLPDILIEYFGFLFFSCLTVVGCKLLGQGLFYAHNNPIWSSDPSIGRLIWIRFLL